MRIWAIRVAALAILLLLALLAALGSRTLSRLPDTVVYFVASSDDVFTLERSYRSTVRGAPEAHIRAAIQKLVEGPTAAERNRGLATALPPDLRVLDVQVEESVAFVDLSREMQSGGGSALMRGRLEQLFYTVTQPSGIEGVALSVEGRPLDVLGGEGILVERPWYRDDHPGLPVW